MASSGSTGMGFWPEEPYKSISEHADHVRIRISICSHIEGSTPIDNWFICKYCGENLRKVK